MDDEVSIFFRLCAILIMLCILFSIVGTVLLIIQRLKSVFLSYKVINAIWWGVEIFATISVLALLGQYVSLEWGDRYSRGMLLYMMIFWLSPIIVCGALGFFLKPKR